MRSRPRISFITTNHLPIGDHYYLSGPIVVHLYPRYASFTSSSDKRRRFFSQTAFARDYARTNWQPYQWSDYYQKNFKQGPECVQAMRLYWCMDALGVADPRGDFNTYGLIPCPSVCEYVFRSCTSLQQKC